MSPRAFLFLNSAVSVVEALLTEPAATEVADVCGVIRELDLRVPDATKVAVVGVRLIPPHLLELGVVGEVGRRGGTVLVGPGLMEGAGLVVRGPDGEVVVGEAQVGELAAQCVTGLVKRDIADALEDATVEDILADNEATQEGVDGVDARVEK